MFCSQVNVANILVKDYDIDGALMSIFDKNSLKWKAMKKLRKSGKMTTLRSIGDSIWNTVREVKMILTGSIEKSITFQATSFLQQLKLFNEPVNAMDKIQSAAPIKLKTANAAVCDNFYAALQIDCVKYKMTPPIILYGRLFEDERFQYVSFLFGKHVFIIELTTAIIDIQERACETMCALIRICRGVPKVSSFVKVLGNVAHIIAEIDIHNETFTLCESIRDDIEILNLNELTDLIIASHYLSNQPCSRIEDICAQTLFYKQPFLEGLYVNKTSVFGLIDQSKKNVSSPAPYPIVLVFCDTITQSNFLWNNKPVTVNAKKLMSTAVNCVASKMPYQQMELLTTNVVSEDSNECGGIRYGDQILYDGPLVLVFD